MNLKHTVAILLAGGKPAAVFLLVLLTSACVQPANLLRPQADSPLSELSVLDYYLRLKSLPASDIDKMHLDLKQQTDMDPAIRLVQTAMLLSVPSNATAEQEQLALESLAQAINTAGMDSSPEAQAYREFAVLWRDVLRRRQELKQISGDLITELSDEREKVMSLQQEIQGLIKKINALKSIEQKMDTRIQTLEPAE